MSDIVIIGFSTSGILALFSLGFAIFALYVIGPQQIRRQARIRQKYVYLRNEYFMTPDQIKSTRKEYGYMEDKYTKCW